MRIVIDDEPIIIAGHVCFCLLDGGFDIYRPGLALDGEWEQASGCLRQSDICSRLPHLPALDIFVLAAFKPGQFGNLLGYQILQVTSDALARRDTASLMEQFGKKVEAGGLGRFYLVPFELLDDITLLIGYGVKQLVQKNFFEHLSGLASLGCFNLECLLKYFDSGNGPWNLFHGKRTLSLLTGRMDSNFFHLSITVFVIKRFLKNSL